MRLSRHAPRRSAEIRETLRPTGTFAQNTSIRGYPDRAIDACSKAIEIDPKEGPAYATRGIAYARRSEFARAIADYTKAIEISNKKDDPLLQPRRRL